MNFAPTQNDDKAEPLVSIILVNWNGKDDTLGCLASLKKITYRNYKIILIDNASTDGSVHTICRDFPEIEIIENSENRRFAAANNQGIERALATGAELVLLLNNDTEVAPDFLDEMVHAVRSRPEIGMAGPKIFYYHDRQRIWFAGGEINFWKGRTAHRGLRRMDSDEWNASCETDYITGCALLVTRDCIEKIGVLDESYYIYSEDADWCMRALRADFKCWFVPSAHVWHKISASSGGGLTSFKAYHKVRSNFLFFKRYARWWHWLTIPWCVAGGALVETARLLFDRQTRASVVAALWRAFADIFRRKSILPENIQKDKRYQN